MVLPTPHFPHMNYSTPSTRNQGITNEFNITIPTKFLFPYRRFDTKRFLGHLHQLLVVINCVARGTWSTVMNLSPVKSAFPFEYSPPVGKHSTEIDLVLIVQVGQDDPRNVVQPTLREAADYVHDVDQLRRVTRLTQLNPFFLRFLKDPAKTGYSDCSSTKDLDLKTRIAVRVKVAVKLPFAKFHQ